MLFIVFVLFLYVSNVICAPFPKKVVDMTYTFDESTQKFPLFKAFNFSLKWNGSYHEVPWVQTEEYSSSTHAGTHMDAPSHAKLGGRNVEQLDARSFVAPAAVVDVREDARLDADLLVTVQHLRRWEETAGRSLDGTILLLNTGWGAKYYNQTAYLGTANSDPHDMHFPGLDPVAAQWLVDERSIVGLGTDCLSFDRGASTDFLSHVILLGSGLFGLENVANVDKIPISGAILYVMPIKIKNASGSPTRIVAVFPDVVY